LGPKQYFERAYILSEVAVVTYNVSPEDKALFLEVLGSYATLTYLNEIPAAQREQSLERANMTVTHMRGNSCESLSYFYGRFSPQFLASNLPGIPSSAIPTVQP
jgi:hypothetical protein